MRKISDFIVSYDIWKILNGINAFDFDYMAVPSRANIDALRGDFEVDINKVFNGKVTIVSEDDMMEVNSLVRGNCPHRYAW